MIYTFQKRGIHAIWSGQRSRSEAHAHNLKEFNKRINENVGDASDGDTLGNTIHEFVDIVHGNAHWYNRSVAKEYFLQWVFFILSLLLLIAIPIGISRGVPELIDLLEKEGDAAENEVLTAQVLAVLTGIIALQRALAAWFANRRNLGRRWKARSDLISIIYDIERKHQVPGKKIWKPNAKSLQEDLVAGIKKAREIVDAETLEFFENFALPSIDVGASIVSSRAVASKIYSAFRAPVDAVLDENREKRRRAIELERQHRKYEENIDLLQQSFDAANQELKDLGEDKDQLNAQEREYFMRLVHEVDTLETDIRVQSEKKLRAELERKILLLR